MVNAQTALVIHICILEYEKFSQNLIKTDFLPLIIIDTVKDNDMVKPAVLCLSVQDYRLPRGYALRCILYSSYCLY